MHISNEKHLVHISFNMSLFIIYQIEFKYVLSLAKHLFNRIYYSIHVIFRLVVKVKPITYRQIDYAWIN